MAKRETNQILGPKICKMQSKILTKDAIRDSKFSTKYRTREQKYPVTTIQREKK